MNDNQVKALRDYYRLLTDSQGKMYDLKSFGRIVMSNVPLDRAIEFGRYYKNVEITEHKEART